MIICLFENLFFCIGLVIYIFMFYNLDYKISVCVELDVLNVEIGKIDQWLVDMCDKLFGNGDMVCEFWLQILWIYNVSLGYIIGISLVLGVEYEYQDYLMMKF